MSPKRGEVWWVDFEPTLGSEPNKIRPAVLLQLDSLSGLGTRLIVPITSNQEHPRHRGNVTLPRGEGGLLEASVALGHLVSAVDISRFIERLGLLSDHYVSEIELAVAHCLGIAI